MKPIEPRRSQKRIEVMLLTRHDAPLSIVIEDLKRELKSPYQSAVPLPGILFQKISKEN